MKKTGIILSVLLTLLSTTLQAQEIAAEDLELYAYHRIIVKDFDNDQIKDTVYFDDENSVIICKLSSQNFNPITSLSINEWKDEWREIEDIENGFSLRINIYRDERAEYWANQFKYELETKKIRLIQMYHSMVWIGIGFGRGSALI